MTTALDGYLFTISLLSADPLPRLSVNDGIICIRAGAPCTSFPWNSFNPISTVSGLYVGDDPCRLVAAFEDPWPLCLNDLVSVPPGSPGLGASFFVKFWCPTADPCPVFTRLYVYPRGCIPGTHHHRAGTLLTAPLVFREREAAEWRQERPLVLERSSHIHQQPPALPQSWLC